MSYKSCWFNEKRIKAISILAKTRSLDIADVKLVPEYGANLINDVHLNSELIRLFEDVLLLSKDELDDLIEKDEQLREIGI